MTNSTHINISADKETRLLTEMLKDANEAEAFYRPGPYWLDKGMQLAKYLKKNALNDFRGNSPIALSFGDHSFVDASKIEFKNSFVAKCFRWIIRLPGFRRIWSRQMSLTAKYLRTVNMLQGISILSDPRTKELLENFDIEDSLRFDCSKKIEISGKEYSTHYLNLLNTHNKAVENLNFDGISTVMEIGGGYGAYLHILRQNHPNLVKFLYVDIAPNLLVGTEYLRALYGEAVKDYIHCRQMGEICFSNDQELEILCIAPHQLSVICSTLKIDYFVNWNSFVEMPISVVENYAKIVCKLINPDSGMICLASYDAGESNTIPPTELPGLFVGRDFDEHIIKRLDSCRNEYIFISQ